MITVVRDRNIIIEIHSKNVSVERMDTNSISVILDSGERFDFSSHYDTSIVIYDDD